MFRSAHLPVCGISAIVLAGSAPAFAIPTCNVGGDRDTIVECLAVVEPDGTIILPDNSRHVIPGLVLNKSVTIKTATDGIRATVSQQPLYALPDDVYESGFPFPVEPMFLVMGEAEIRLEDLTLQPYSQDVGGIDTTLSRILHIESGEVTAHHILVEGVHGGVRGADGEELGGYVAYAQGAGASLILEDSEIADVNASAHLGGAIVADNGASISIYGDTTFDRCLAYKGGAVYARYGVSVEVAALAGSGTPTFRNNVATTDGGAIAVSFGATIDGAQTPSFLDIKHGLFADNSAGANGGHLAVHRSQLSTADVRLLRGRATAGAGLHLSQSTQGIAFGEASIGVDTTFDGNVASEAGGGVYAEGSDLTIADAEFESNEVELFGTDGGGLYMVGGTLEMTGTTLTGNSASGGGGAFLADVASPDIRNNVFTSNASQVIGGGLYSRALDGSEVVRGNVFCGNTAPSGAAAAFVGSAGTGRLTLENNLVDGLAQVESLGIYVSGRDYTIKNNAFMRTEGIAVELAGGTGELSRNLFGWNLGPEVVSAVAVADVPSTIEGNAFWDPEGQVTAWIRAAGADIGTGDDAVLENPRLTYEIPRGGLASDCRVEDHFMRPDSPLVLRGWEEPDVQEDVIGLLGGAEDPYLVWSRNGDSDPVVAVWDCDDGNDEVHERLVQYWDADGDGYQGSPVEGFACELGSGHSRALLDCDDSDGSVFEGCDDPDDPDDPGDPLEPEGVYWYGSTCASTQSGATWWLVGLPLLLLGRRRR